MTPTLAKQINKGYPVNRILKKLIVRLQKGLTMEKHFSEQEIEELKEEIEHYQKEKEQLRQVIGQVGGAPKFNTKLINTIFIGAIIVSVIVSVLGDQRWRFAMSELAILALSLKILYMMHCMMRVNHFKFWMLSSIEWRLNEITKKISQFKD
jgi:hypothetical protein